MPYYQRSWSGSEEQAPKNGRKLRKVPYGEKPKDPKANGQQKQEQVSAEPSKANAARKMLKYAVEELKAVKCASAIKGDEDFLNYVIQKDQVIFEGKFSSIFICFNNQVSPQAIVARMFLPNSMIVAENDVFLKVLRHLGQKNPCILSTYDLYADESRHIYIFQEYGNRGNAYDFIKAKNVLTEKIACKWAQSIYAAMDFLGDQAISHRSIMPKHILLKSGEGNEVEAKLTSFRDAIIYWDPASSDIIDQPCKPPSKRVNYAFQAPEVFGDEGEFYNPVDADVYSFGATFFFLAGRGFPYNFQSPEANVDEAIQKNVKNARLSEPAKQCLYGMMRANTDLRTQFDAIATDPWFAKSA